VASLLGGSGFGRGIQLRRKLRREGIRRDLLIVIAAAASSIVLLVGVAWIFLPARTTVVGSANAGAGGGDPLDVSIDRVIVRQVDGRRALGSFTLRLRADLASAALRDVAERTPTPQPSDKPGGKAPPTTIPRDGTIESVLRERISAALSGLNYDETAGEAGKERLRQAVRDAANRGLRVPAVDQVFVREYLVQ
jgi:hypothetical protein